MKINKIILGIAFSVLLFGCSKDESSTLPTVDQTDVSADTSLQEMSEDINFEILDQTQKNISLLASKQIGSQGCPTVTKINGSILLQQPITVKIDYGSGCINDKNKYHEGVIQYTLSNYTFNPNTKELINYTLACNFTNFGNAKFTLNGTSNIVCVNGVWTINFDHTAVSALGKTYARKGVQVREFTNGYDTKDNFDDDIIKITGSWTTTTPNGIHNVSITTPFILDFSCDYKLVEGIMKIERKNTTATLDYGYKKDGTTACDNWYEITINNLTPIYLQFGL